MKRKIVAVSEINRYVNHLLEEDYLLGDVWLSGEVSNCKYHQSGHVYFSLKDERAGISAVMFAKDAATLDFQLKEGLAVYVRGRIALYEKTGQYQFYVWEVEKQGKGTLYEQFERLKNKLAEEGLFDPKFKKPLPPYPQKVGIITSRTGAALHDMMQVAKRRNEGVTLYVYPAQVQGLYGVDEIVAAIERANQDALVDVLIVGRGGGSIEDLWCFNEEKVARAIFDSHIPVVSAVGHETDFTISDFVSDLRAPTPSAAAEIVIPSREEYEKRLKQMKDRLKGHMDYQIRHRQMTLKQLLERPVYRNKHKYFEDLMIHVDDTVSQLTKAYTMKIQKAHYGLENRIGKLEKLSPLLTLKRGYSFVSLEDGKPLTHANQVEKGDTLKLTVQDGTLYTTVERKEP